MKKGWLLFVCACATVAFAADDPQELQARIDAARARLDAAAHELAQLAQQLGNDTPFEVAIPGPRARVSLGLLLMPGGRDGVAIAGVTPGGGAAAAGIQAGDVLVAVNGTNLKEAGAKPPAARVFELLDGVAPGDTVRVDYQRGTETLSADIVAKEPMPMPTAGFAVSTMGFAPGCPGTTAAFAGRVMIGGFELFDVDETLGHYFGVSDGVLVLNAPGAGAGGLLAGDIIKTVGGSAITSSEQCLDALSRSKGEVVVEVLRDGAVVPVLVDGVAGGPALMPLPPPPSGAGVHMIRMSAPPAPHDVN